MSFLKSVPWYLWVGLVLAWAYYQKDQPGAIGAAISGLWPCPSGMTKASSGGGCVGSGVISQTENATSQDGTS